MIAAWMLYCVLCALGLSLAAAAAEHTLLAERVPFRHVWTVAVLLYRGLQQGINPYYDAGAVVKPGALPIGFLIQAYATGTFVVLLNEIRTLGAHRRAVGDGTVDLASLELAQHELPQVT